MVLMLPIAAGCYRAAARAGDLSAGTVILSVLIGAALMATPVVMLKIKDRPYFRRTGPEGSKCEQRRKRVVDASRIARRLEDGNPGRIDAGGRERLEVALDPQP